MLSLRPPRTRLCHFAAAAAATTSTSSDTTTSTSSSTPSKPLEPPALDKLKSERNPDALCRLFQANATNPLLVENRFAFHDTVCRLAGANRFDYIERLLEQQKRLPQGRREGFVVRIIILYGKAGMTHHAINTFYDMHLFRCPRTVKSFNATLMRAEVAPDEVTFNLVIKGFCQAGFIDMAQRVYDSMHGKGYKPNNKIYQTMIHHLCKCGDFSLAYTMCKDSMQKNWFPNIDTICMLLECLKGTGEIRRARVILRLAEGRKPPFSSDCLAAMRSILCRR